MWKTRESEVKGKKMFSMICQNSEPEKSKWGKFAPENGPCTNWVNVGPNATASLCSECVQRSVNIRIPNQ